MVCREAPGVPSQRQAVPKEISSERLPWSPVAPWPRPLGIPAPLLGEPGSDIAELVYKIPVLISVH